MRTVPPPTGHVTIQVAPGCPMQFDLRVSASLCKKRARQGWSVHEPSATHTGLALMATKLTARSGMPRPFCSTCSRATTKRGKRAVVVDLDKLQQNAWTWAQLKCTRGPTGPMMSCCIACCTINQCAGMTHGHVLTWKKWCERAPDGRTPFMQMSSAAHMHRFLHGESKSDAYPRWSCYKLQRRSKDLASPHLQSAF
eukprot:353021-Chlamydomonas_euryale.AAC.3